MKPNLIGIVSLFVLWAIAAQAQIADPELLAAVRVASETETAYDVAWSPNGEMLAVIGGLALTLYSSEDLEPLFPTQQGGEWVSTAWLPRWFEGDEAGGQLAITGGFRSPTIHLYDFFAADGSFAPHREIQTDADQYVVSWSPDGERLATLASREENVIQIWDVSTDKFVEEFALSMLLPDEGEFAQYDVEWDADSLHIWGAAGAGVEGEPFIYRLNTSTGDVEIYPATAHMQAFTVSPDGTLFAIVDEDGLAHLIMRETGETIAVFQSVELPVSVRFSPDGAKLAILSYHTPLQLWDVSQINE